MTPPPDPADPPGPWPDVLAAYADGELDDATRAAVERWLAAHPRARGCVDAQREFSPENWRLWCAAQPPRPCPGTWDAVRDGITAGLALPRLAEPAPAKGVWRRRAEWTLVATACGLTLFVISLAAFGAWFLPPGPQRVIERVARPAVEDPLAGIAVLPVATDADVDVHRVDGAGAGGWLPVGGVPLSGPLALATADDVELEEAEEHPAWPAGGPRVVRDPADAPVLFPDPNR
jgi:anti-sigma factor RsiW